VGVLRVVRIPGAGYAAEGALDVAQPEGWDRALALAEPRDLNPDPHILEISLEAKLGDRLIVHFRNSLPEATTIHGHDPARVTLRPRLWRHDQPPRLRAR
jgi:hypothetical protein